MAWKIFRDLWVAGTVAATKKTTAWKAFRDLWVAGTVGGFLAALMRSLPLDARKLWFESPGGLFTFDLALRYAYLLWFIAYFFLSNLRKDELEKWDVAFDVIQSAASFAAAFALGIAVHGEGYQFDRSSEAFQFANAAILTISFFSLVFFLRRDNWTQKRPLHLLRILGGVTAIVGLLVSRNQPLSLLALAVTLAILTVLLILFGRIRMNDLPI